MAYKELGITVIQRFTAANGPIAIPLLPLLTYGPAYNVQERVSHGSPVDYNGSSDSVSYPNLGTGEYVDLGDKDTWGENENVYPVSVFISNGKKSTGSSVSGYFGHSNHGTGTKTAATTTIAGFPTGFWKPSSVGRSVYVHTGDALDRGIRTVSSVSANGDTVILSGAVWNTGSEASNVSILPSSGTVSRLYSAGGFADSRIGDFVEIGPAFTTSYAIKFVDTSAGYIDIEQAVAPTGNDTSWRVVAEFDSVSISNTQTEKSIELVRGTDFTYDRDSIDIVSGIVDPAAPSGPVVSGNLKISYRALKTSLAATTGKIEISSDINNVGIQTEENPLAISLAKSFENTTFTLYYTGADVTENVKNGVTEFNGPADLDYSDQLERISDEDMYVLNCLSQYNGHNTELSNHVTGVSDPAGIYNRVRVGIINTSLPTESNVQQSASHAVWDIAGVTEVQAFTDGKMYEKSGRLYSRGSQTFPDFDGLSSPLPVNSKTDLVKLSGGTITQNDGFWGVEKSEKLVTKDPSNALESAPNRKYFASYGSMIRSGTVNLTASDNGGLVRLTSANGTFRFVDVSSLPSQGRAFLPGRRNGIICSVTAVDATNYSYIDTDITWDASYATTGVSQLSIDEYDAVFSTPGMTSQVHSYTNGAATTTSATNIVTAIAGFFTGMIGMSLMLTGTTAGADDGYHEIIAVNIAGDEATVASLSTDDVAITVDVAALKVSGAAGEAEFASVSVGDPAAVLYAGKDFALSGTKVIGTKDIDSFPANTWGVNDVGRTVMIYEAAGVIEYLTILAVVSPTEITTDVAVNFAASNNITCQIADQDTTPGFGLVIEKDPSDDYVIFSTNWSQKYAGNSTTALRFSTVELGFGDIERVLRILSGAYAGQTYQVTAVRGEELSLSNLTAFGTGSTLGAESSAEDLVGFEIEFTASPGNNAFKLSDREGSSPQNEAGKTFSIQRDFRHLDVTGETFVTNGIISGDFLRISSPASMAGDYEVDSVPSETELIMKVGSEFSLSSVIAEIDGGSLAAMIYEVIKIKTKDQQAETIRDYASSFSNRRLILTWPDICLIPIDGVDVQVPGYYIGSIVGAFIAGFPPQRPLSRTKMTGISKVLHSKVDNHFKRTHLNTIASGGVMIVHQQDENDIPHIRHQLSTDTSDIKFQEVSITKIIDYITRIIKVEFEQYTGKYNIGDLLISKLKTVAQSIVTFCENQLDATAGPLVNEIEFSNIAPSATIADEVDMDVDIDAPVPFNRLTVNLRA